MSDPLFELVASLSKGDKRSFKLYLSRYNLGKKSNSVKLFDVLDKMEQYDIAVLKKKLRRESFVNNLAYEKYRLYNLILESLRARNKKYSIAAQLSEQIQDIEILYDKGLISQALKLVHKAKKKAQGAEEFGVFLKLCFWEKQLEIKALSIKTLDQTLPNILSQEQHTYEQLQEINALYGLLFKLYQTYITSPQILTETLKDQYETTFLSLLQRYEKVHSYTANRTKINCWEVYAMLTQNKALHIQYSTQNVLLLEKKVKENVRFQSTYHTALFNLTLAYTNEKNYAAALQQVEKLKAFPETFKKYHDTPYFDALWAKTTTLDILLHILSGDLETVLRDYPDMEAIVKHYIYCSTAVDLVVLHYLMAFTYFLLEIYDQALAYTIAIINNWGSEQSTEYLLFSTNMIRILSHYELGHYKVIPSIIASAQRQLTKTNQWNAYEKRSFHFIQQELLNKAYRPDFNTKMEKLYLQLKAMRTKETAGQLQTQFNMVFWLRSQLRGISLRGLYEAHFR